ncbi:MULTISPECIES: GAF domain-containing protein [unclassified Achromobacter]|uniref:GAF domain-containing protein n=1 Tax=unclassified Achromobacter TaxID=2626865 RepID=UPI0011779FEF|nr:MULTISPECIES: GAF domain-containing protein [unclassified Achromobacter]
MRVNPIPGVDRPPIWYRKWFFEVVGAVPVVGAAVFTMVRFWRSPQDRLFADLALGVVVWVCLVSLLKIQIARRQDSKEAPEETHDGLYAAVSVAHAAIKNLIELQSDTEVDLRATFHRVVPPLDNPQRLQQIIAYIGDSDSAGAGRTFSVNTGITGQAVRNKEPYIMESVAATEAEHRAELVADWGYTTAQVAQIKPGRITAAALPVLDRSGQHVLGVLYLDSSVPRIFSESQSWQMLVAIGDAVGDYVTRRY